MMVELPRRGGPRARPQKPKGKLMMMELSGNPWGLGELMVVELPRRGGPRARPQKPKGKLMMELSGNPWGLDN